MDIGVGEMAFIFCGKHPLLVTRTQVSDPGTKSHLFIFKAFSYTCKLYNIMVGSVFLCCGFVTYTGLT